MILHVSFRYGSMERSIFKILLIAAATMACGAHADGAGAQFGIVYGMSVPDAENTNPYRMAGVKGEAFITPAFSRWITGRSYCCFFIRS